MKDIKFFQGFLVLFILFLGNLYALTSDDYFDIGDDYKDICPSSHNFNINNSLIANIMKGDNDTGSGIIPGDHDVFKISVTTRGKLTIYTEYDYSDLVDPEGVLKNDTCTQIASHNDISFLDKNFKIEAVVDPGTYYLDVSSAGMHNYEGFVSPLAAGDYELFVDFESYTADIQVTQTDSKDPVLANEEFDYMISVKNNGPTDGDNVQVIDTLPNDVIYISHLAPDFSCSISGNILTCDKVKLDNGDTSTINITVKAPANEMTLTNSVTVTSDIYDTNSANNSDNETTDVLTASADISISKSDSKDPVLINEEFDYTISITNQGPQDADNVRVIDTLPEDVAYISHNAADWSCGISSGILTCDKVKLDSGNTSTITITVKAPNAAMTLSNDVTAASDVDDPSTGNNSDSETTTIQNPSADLVISKTDSKDPVLTNEAFDYTITVLNNGFQDAQNVQVVDTLPGDIIYTGYDVSDWSCSIGGNVLTCDRASLNYNDSSDIIVHVQAPNSAMSVTNSATVTSDINDPNNGNNNASEITNIVTPSADLRISKTDSEDPVLINETFDYTITVTNNGPQNADNVVVTDTLPNDIIYISHNAPEWSCSLTGTTFTCNKATLNSGTASTITITVKAPGTPMSLTNSVVVDSDTNDGNSANNSAAETTQILNSGNLIIAKIDSEDPVLINEEFNYTITVANSGPKDIVNLEVNDTLPDDLTYVSYNAPDWTCSFSSNILTCNKPILNDGDMSTITITVKAPNTPMTVTNHAVVDSDTDDLDMSNNNTDESTQIVAPLADIKISKTDSKDPVLINEEFDYEITVKNNGPQDAENVHVEDTIPNDLNFVSFNAADWNCSISGNSFTCDNAMLNSGAASTITLRVKAPNSQMSVTNSVTVVSDTTDSNNGNNSASESTTIAYSTADLEISKIDSEDPVLVDGNFSYTINVTNNGPQDAENVHVEDTLPNDITYLDYSAPGWNCNISGTTFTCDKALFNKYTSSSITINVQAPPSAMTLTNSVTVVSDTNDSSITNNSDSETTEIVFPSVDLEIIKTAPNEIFVDQNFTYELTISNSGNNIAENVELNDTLPSGVIYQSIDASVDWNCNENANTITCIKNVFNNGTSEVIKINVQAPNIPGSIINEAIVTSDLNDTDESNNVDSALTMVKNYQADLKIDKQDSKDLVSLGENFSYTLTVENLGPDIARDIHVEDDLPTNLTYVSYDAPDWNCSKSGSLFSCDMNTMDAAQVSAIIVHVKAPNESTVIYNEVTVNTRSDDPNSNNNKDTEETRVRNSNYTDKNARNFSKVLINDQNHTNIHGDIDVIGNQVICKFNPGTGQCLNPADFGQYTNNDVSQNYANLDNFAKVQGYNSSTSATLNLDASDEVIWAGLYWMGRVQNDLDLDDSIKDEADIVYLRHDINGTYQKVIGDPEKFNWINNGNYFDYQCTAEVTDYVKEYGVGKYWVADIQTTTGYNHSAGWALVIVAKDTNGIKALKNITLFDGFQGVWKSADDINDTYPDSISSTISGFLTPSTGAIDSRLILFSGEGDRDDSNVKDLITITDKMGIEHNLSNGLNPSDDTINGTISKVGVNFTTREPNIENTLGIDIDSFNVSSIIQNQQSSTDITIRSEGDRYFLGMFAFSTQLYIPDVCYIENLTDIDGNSITDSLPIGSEILVNAEIQNRDNESADDAVIQIEIDKILDYSFNSVEIKNVNEGSHSTKTDITGDDISESMYRSDLNQTFITSRIGVGANSVDGGELDFNKSAFIKYKTRILDIPENNSTNNVYKISYSIQNLFSVSNVKIDKCSSFSTNLQAYAPNVKGFDTVHEGGVSDGMDDGYDSMNNPSPENHLYTQIVNQDFSIDLLPLQNDSNTTYEADSKLFEGLVRVDLIDKATDTNLKTEYISINNSSRKTITFLFDQAKRNTAFKVWYVLDRFGLFADWGGDTSENITNIQNMLNRNYRTNPCLTECAVSFDDGCKKCIFEDIGESSDSNDNFAIRPRLIIVDVNETDLIGAKPSTFLFSANDGYVQTIDNSSNKFEFYKINTPAGCSTVLQNHIGNLGTIVFTDGNASKIFAYPNVGDINVSVYDEEWTAVDRNDTDTAMSDCIINNKSETPVGGKVGCVTYGENSFSFKPAQFDNSLTLEDFDNANNFTYVSGNVNMSAKISLMTEAKLFDNTIATNYTSGCYAKDINYTISLLNAPIDWNSGDAKDRVRYFGTTSSSYLSGGYAIGNFSSNESSFINGVANNLEMDVNFDRNKSIADEPFTLSKNDFNITLKDADHVTGDDFDRSSDQNATFYFARIHMPDYVTDKSVFTASLFYEIYCKNCDKSLYAFAKKEESKDSVFWYINNDVHTAASGNYSSAESLNNTEISNLQNQSLDLGLPAGQRAPYRDRIILTPSNWLVYNQHKETAATQSAKVYFMGSSSDWAGRGKLGFTVDKNVSRRKNKRLDW